MTNKKNNLIWIDLEMTGLNVESDAIIEIATVITDKNLNILAEGPSLAIHQSNNILDNMNDWCIEQHGKSGLTQSVKNSDITLKEAEQQTINFLQQWVKEGASPMCGNSICQDRRFLAKYMPQLEQFFHYRHIDVSTIKELAVRWTELAEIKKDSNHLALDDIYDSINELKYYKEYFIK